MGKKKADRRIDVSGKGEIVPDDRMAALAALFGSGAGEAKNTKRSPVDDTTRPTTEGPPRSTEPWSVARTRKGSFHVSLEKRPGNKVVTVVHGVSGDCAALLRDLKRLCGAGGTVRSDTVEVQGDHREALLQMLMARLG